MSNSRRQPQKRKPEKPYADFPLYAHKSGKWAKKIRGKFYYFGSWDDPQGALAAYLDQKDRIYSGVPIIDPGSLTVRDAANSYLLAKQAKVQSGELSPNTFTKYREAAEELRHLGKRAVTSLLPHDFAQVRQRMAAKWGVYRLADMIQHVRSVFKYAFEAGLIDKPVRFGPDFARPSAKSKRLHRATQGPKLFTAAEVRRLIDAANVTLRAMILLGINCGFGNSDCANLPLAAVDLDRAMIDFPRPKTGVPRRCSLWPETVDALRTALAARRRPTLESDRDLVFITQRGGSFAASAKDRPISQVMGKLLKKLAINGRKGIGFYTLRTTFRTVADEAKDQPAADFIMGHEAPHMSTIYRQRIDDCRLRAVADYVRRWLFPSAYTLAASE